MLLPKSGNEEHGRERKHAENQAGIVPVPYLDEDPEDGKHYGDRKSCI
jgi:hypothetical protein